ncbi:hypothetical protein AB0H88_40025 [Nonomuraea sp. NPDC050680]|uniref:hypothetical protein n=1 Tax=Nonomuraea sp. NPDC050680 TaxID=3154630 RepID=UPI0033D90F5F
MLSTLPPRPAPGITPQDEPRVSPERYAKPALLLADDVTSPPVTCADTVGW